MVINTPKKHGYYTCTIIQPWSLTHTDSLSSLCSCVSVSQDSLSVYGGGPLVPPHELLHQTAGQRGGSSSSPGCYYRRRGARDEDQPSGTHTHTHTHTLTHTLTHTHSLTHTHTHSLTLKHTLTLTHTHSHTHTLTHTEALNLLQKHVSHSSSIPFSINT